MLRKDSYLILSSPQILYSGLAPSTSHPSSFLGCIRNIELNGEKLRILGQSKTKSGCVAPNGCLLASNNCLNMSKCIRDWDRHSCKCFHGIKVILKIIYF